jgi:serine/threonine protein kinase
MREIGIAAQLSHPHIVPLIDSGESDGALWYVSPYIAGGSLRDRLDREKKLPIDDALRITPEIGAALDYAHRNGFVHRDVKPENILFADDLALLADFGIAHVATKSPDEPLTERLRPAAHLVHDRAASGETDVASPAMFTGSPAFSTRCSPDNHRSRERLRARRWRSRSPKSRGP